MSLTLLASLYELTKSNRVWGWSIECSEELTKEVLNSSQFLVPFNPELPLVVTIDSSSYGVGAVISHIINNVENLLHLRLVRC